MAMNMRDALVAALKRDPELLPKVTDSLRTKISEGEDGPIHTVIQAAEALEPIIRDAVRRRPSKLGAFGLKSAHLLASLAADDRASNTRLTRMARGGIVAIVFVDVADFTAITAERGDKEALRIISELAEIIERIARRMRGELVKTLGDGFLLAFPSASQGVRAAVNIRDAVEKEKSLEAELRIAVHAGEPLVDQDDLLGHDVNITARLLDHCKPGGVLVSEAARELAEPRLRTIAFGRRRTVKVRGLASKIDVSPVHHRPKTS
jgi:adenylate cyclase